VFEKEPKKNGETGEQKDRDREYKHEDSKTVKID
jgi:hypothetical protein